MKRKLRMHLGAMTVAPLFVLACIGQALAIGCGDQIEDPGKDTAVHYKNQSFNWKHAACEPSSGVKKYPLSLHSAKTCAAPRIDGCSLHEAKYLFSDRDKKLMTASCNIHDLCYSTYHDEPAAIAKVKCDTEFGENLTVAKLKFGGTYNVTTVVSAVLVFGGISGGQAWAKDHKCGTD